MTTTSVWCAKASFAAAESAATSHGAATQPGATVKCRNQKLVLLGRPHYGSGLDHPSVQQKEIMAFKVNYNQQRAERDRAKAAKNEAKQREKEEETARRKAEREIPTSATDASSSEEKLDGES